MTHFFYLPPDYQSDEHGALGVCIEGVLLQIRKPGQGLGDLFTAPSLFDRVFNGPGQGGDGVDKWEVARWKHRHLMDVGSFSGTLEDDAFLVWIDEASYFKPNFKVYSNEEFVKVFIYCCEEFVRENPDLSADIDQALALVGPAVKVPRRQG